MIDWVQIRQLEEDIGEEDFGDIVSLFLEEVDEVVAQLSENPPDTSDKLAPKLHFLKGSAYNLGFKAFGDYCSEGEKLSLEGKGEDVEIAKIITLYTDSKDAFFRQAADHCSFVPD
ncbi:MAG: Hpt domain-containing protein [Rhodobacteraceae bacterium]|nr:Hpt domain-containing protein [Paracoccaceae bacterium]